MEKAAAALDPVRYGLFCATYASMRVIDDFVDDEFLAQPAPRRAADRPSARAVVEGWRTGAMAALTTGAAPAKGDRFQATLAALAACHGVAVLDPAPWDKLAGAMQRDIDERPMPDWTAFLDYAEGATAAPAAVFIEILALRPAAGGRLASALEGPAVARIRNAAILLYLVHIMRDLAKDAAKGAVLLTLPESLFQEIGADATSFVARAAAEPALVADVRARVADYAGRFLLPALGELTALDAVLAPGDSAILRGLCEPYIERYETFAAGL